MPGWIGIAVYVTAYDTWAGLSGRRTLSSEFRDHSKVRPMVMVVGTAYMVTHLFGWFPRRYDPLSQYTVVCGKARNRKVRCAE